MCAFRHHWRQYNLVGTSVTRVWDDIPNYENIPGTGLHEGNFSARSDLHVMNLRWTFPCNHYRAGSVQTNTSSNPSNICLTEITFPAHQLKNKGDPVNCRWFMMCLSCSYKRFCANFIFFVIKLETQICYVFVFLNAKFYDSDVIISSLECRFSPMCYVCKCAH